MKATSTVDTSKSGTASITVYANENQLPTVASVTVSPATATLTQGGTRQFTATVSGTNNPAQTVTWSVTGGGNGTSINESGVLTVAASETATSLTVKATSTVDTSKSGTASITVSGTSTVTSVTVSPATANLAKGATEQFTATVSGTNSPAQTVTWSVTGGGTGTSINDSGLLTVGTNESAATLTVKAASTVDPSKFGTASVTVYAGAGQLPTVTSVTVSPATANLARGGTKEFTAAVTGTNSPAQTVTWSVTGGGNGTSINESGVLSVAANETAASLTVQATSTVDTSKSGTASVTVSGGGGNSINSIAGIQTYLNAASGGTTAAEPVFLNVQLTLADTSNGWTALLNTIQSANKFVALDLSASTLSGTEYDPGAANTGESKIVSLVLPNTATSIKAGSNDNPTFENFTGLSSVSGSAVETIGDFAFYACAALTSVNLPAASSFGDGAFASCTALTSVNLPAASSFGNIPFYVCTALTSVNLPATLTTIDVNPFMGCIKLATITVASDNPNYSAQNGMLLNKAGTTLIAYPSATGAVTLNTVSSIGDYAFYACTALTSVSLPAATSIGDTAFLWCDALTTVSLPVASSIGDGAFGNCAALTTVSLPAASSIGDDAFNGCAALTTVSLPAASSIGDSAFFGCTALTSVSLPAASSIGGQAFRDTGSGNLTVILGSTAPTLGYRMFSSVNAAKTVIVKVPSGATGYGTLPTTYSGADATVNWGNGFRGMGWTGSAFTNGNDGSINSNITLTIQAQ